MNKKAEMGIGTLIIFISMILVAAIAAGVLLQTAGSLQSKALLVGQKSKSQVSTILSPILMTGEDGQDSTLENFFIKLKLAPGSDPLKLQDILVEMDLNDKSADIEYKNDAKGLNCSYGVDGFYTNTGTGLGNFTVKYLINGSNNKNGYLVRGDVIELCFRGPTSLIEDEEFSVRLVPKVGTTAVVAGVTPDVITDQRVVIYP